MRNICHRCTTNSRGIRVNWSRLCCCDFSMVSGHDMVLFYVWWALEAHKNMERWAEVQFNSEFDENINKQAVSDWVRIKYWIWILVFTFLYFYISIFYFSIFYISIFLHFYIFLFYIFLFFHSISGRMFSGEPWSWTYLIHGLLCYFSL